MEVWETTDYRDAIHSIFQEKKKKSRVSLRGFARIVSLSPSTLHGLFSKSTHLSRARVLEVTSKLKLSRELKKHCLLSFDLAIAKGEAKRKSLESRILGNRVAFQTYLTEAEHFHRIANFETLAINEWLTLHSRRLDVKEISKALGFTPAAVEDSLAALLEFGYIKKGVDQKWLRTRKRVIARSTQDNELLKKIHVKALEHAREAVHAQSASIRYSATEFVSVDPSLMPEMKELTNEYLHRLQALAAKSEKRGQLYTASICLFRLDRGEG